MFGKSQSTPTIVQEKTSYSAYSKLSSSSPHLSSSTSCSVHLNTLEAIRTFLYQQQIGLSEPIRKHLFVVDPCSMPAFWQSIDLTIKSSLIIQPFVLYKTLFMPHVLSKYRVFIS
jgi:hypothetical protein